LRIPGDPNNQEGSVHVNKDAEGNFTVTISRVGRRCGRSFDLSVKFLVTSFIVALCFLTAGIFSSVHYYRMWIHSHDYASLHGELDRLRKEDERLRLTAKQLGDQIAALQVTAQRLRMISGFDADSFGGVGGPARNTDPVLSLSQNDISRHFRTLDRRRLTLETELRQLQDYYTTREILLAATPSIMPVKGYPSDRFGERADPFSGDAEFHPGIDISAPRGAKVVATADGLVVYAGRRLGYGKLVAIEHKFGISTRYGHLDRFAVRAGQRVKKGDIIGYVGSTGRATGVHLHYEVRLRNQPLNPFRFMQDSL
jgi:murein DD-endopeptidase MepM/ murein hydrolase activator NlpD